MYDEKEDHCLAKFFPASGPVKSRKAKNPRKTRSDKGAKRGPRQKLVLTELAWPDE